MLAPVEHATGQALPRSYFYVAATSKRTALADL
jgi:hypothetical protein